MVAQMDVLLAMDTSTHTASVAVVARDGRALAERENRVSTHSETLLALIDAALGAAGNSIGEVAGVACGAGPGSFTGLRIGLATAKGLCFACERPLVLVPSLEALAAEAPVGTLAIACIDARKGEVFAAAYWAGRVVAPEAAYRPEAMLPAAAALGERHPGAPRVLVGDAVTRYPGTASAGEWRVPRPLPPAGGRANGACARRPPSRWAGWPGSASRAGRPMTSTEQPLIMFVHPRLQ